MARSDLTEFEVEEEGFKIKIQRASERNFNAPAAPSLIASGGSPSPSPSIVAVSPIPFTAVANNAGSPDDTGFAYVKSPMVGTFYKSPSSDSPAFVAAGDKVEEKSVVCIIEAMKIMNEIQAETKGTVVELLVENGQPVEYGQRLFKIKLG